MGLKIFEVHILFKVRGTEFKMSGAFLFTFFCGTFSPESYA